MLKRSAETAPAAESCPKTAKYSVKKQAYAILIPPAKNSDMTLSAAFRKGNLC